MQTENYANAALLFRALDSELRRGILDILKEPMSTIQALEHASEMGFAIRHRETIYKNLEILADAKVLYKHNSGSGNRDVTYELRPGRFFVDPADMSATLENSPSGEIAGKRLEGERADLVFRALSNGTRREIMKMLLEKQMYTGDIQEKLAYRGISARYKETVWGNLRVLHGAGLVYKRSKMSSGLYWHNMVLYGSDVRQIAIDTRPLSATLLRQARI